MSHNRMTAVMVRGCAVHWQRCPMQQHNHDFTSRHLAVVRAKLAEGLRARHDLMEPLAPTLVELLQQLDASALDRETQGRDSTRISMRGVAAMVHSAPGKPGE
jgi:hypothetical protein